MTIIQSISKAILRPVFKLILGNYLEQLGKNFQRYFQSLCLLVILIFSSCVSQKNEPIVGLEELSTNYNATNSTNAALKLNYYDVVPYLKIKGLIWDPFILPILENYTVSESDLLLGYLVEKDKFIFSPQNGSCKILQNETKYESKSKKLYSFVSGNIYPENDAGSLFLLLDYKNLSPYALVKLNKQGRANCYLPSFSYRVSYNFGSHRKEFVIEAEGKNSQIKVDFEKKGFVQIEPLKENNIRNGDLIRIGRKFEINKNQTNNNNNFIATAIDNDLFNPSNFLSQDMGVDEVFQSNLLVGKTPYSISLEAGDYIIAVLRKNHLICQKEINIQENNSIKLECPLERVGDAENRIFNRNQYNIKFDTTFYPERLNQETHFQSWMLSQKNLFMPILMSENKNNLEEKKFSFIFQSLKADKIKQFSESFSLEVNGANSSLPIFGTGIENISQGAHPFFNFSSISFQYPLEPKNILSNSYLEATNGTEIKIFEPFITQDGILRSVADEQKFRVRISIPAWNSTNIVEMYIDGKLHQRWILSRGDLSEPFSVTLNEKTFKEKNFTVRFTAWGEQPLPNFLYGIDEYMPFSRSRDYFVNILGK